MNLCLIGHDFKYELEKLIRIFLPFEKIEFFNEISLSDDYAITEIKENKATAKVCLNGKTTQFSKIIDAVSEIEKEAELKIATALFNCFTELTGYYPQWGLLTGVRPAKLFSRLSSSLGNGEAEDYFKNKLKVTDKKLKLCKETFEGEHKIISLSEKNSFSLYISIPFCPSRCSYCSFVSHSVESAKKLIPKYVELLCKEIELTAKISKENGLRLETVYIGGGTPTAVSADEIKKIMQAVRENFDLSHLREYTVEAGRPDTFSEEKLQVIKDFGATRISINPQTMNDSVLGIIGRKHTSRDTVDAFNMARKMGFTNINMDLIAGLPGDSYESFKLTLDEILKLNPESVTVHSLSLKRSSFMNLKGDLPETEIGKTASLMVDTAHDMLSANGIVPYYMYRQSKTVGNLENVGYSKKGYECLYNVYIMDETHSILACGASAVTKLREPGGNYIERIFNFKYPYEYIERFNEIISRKDGINSFYADYGYRN
ncbi:MAG: coproporphyrinogen dehydrogenase HemZ [Ruminococcaceae bacterium]|nr:coproporphyrinogen dehydrogenase HemZ [Oscillospiraceae bacterium]